MMGVRLRVSPRAEKSARLTCLRASCELGSSKGEVHAIVHDLLGKRVSSLKQRGEQNLKTLHSTVMAIER